jgi:proteasome lid subunit RPN8/RPN11
MMSPIQLLSISKSEYEKFRSAANASGGAEVCGVMVGSFGNFSSKIEEIRMIKNAAKNVDRAFMMDPQEYLDSIWDTDMMDPKSYKTQYIGIIHSHYFDRALPSIADWNGAENGLCRSVYLIYSVAYEELNAFYWNTKEFTRLEHMICETD